jgi:8-oxo-dGTP pyrophosphatase MutT (NUDIX family)
VLLAPDAALAMDVHGRTQSAVLVPLYEDPEGEVHAVFTRRRDDLRRHAGEISFPGGRRDGDESLLDTALREAHEEIGLAAGAVEVVGALEPTPTFVTDYAIYPFVGVIAPGLEWIVADTEVAEVLELRLRDVSAGRGERRLVRRGMAFRTTTFEVGPHTIWGATARIVADLLARVPTRPSPRGR